MDYLEHPLIKPKKVEARLYQRNLFAACAKSSTLVVLPTGLGKTILFIMITAFKLNKNPDGKVILCAPTKPLLEQHERTIKDLINIDEDLIIQISGETAPEKRKDIWKKGKVFICTPQTLQNDIIQHRVNLAEVVFLCLDEAHKAIGDHSYVFVAEQYNKLSPSPLILGITASPGSDLDRLLELKENLGITNVEIRDETSEDVKEYIHKIEEVWEIIPLPNEFKLIIDTLNSLFKTILEELKVLGIITSADPKNNSRTDLLQLQSLINKKYSNLPNDSETRSEYFSAMALAGNSLRVSHAIELIETQGIPSLSQYLDKQVNSLQQGKGSRALRSLFVSDDMVKVLEAVQILQQKEIIHPKLEKLKEIIQVEVKNNPENRILVFSHFRVTAKNISDELNKIPKAKTHWFVGQSSARGDKGLSQKKQIEIMQQFREGIFNTLVSTSVAEEGLDIGECDLVVFYDSVPSAIRLIQRKGRTGRKKQGRVILLIAEGTRDESYMWASRAQAKKMKNLVKTFSSPIMGKKQKGILEYVGTSTEVSQEEENSSKIKEEKTNVIIKEEINKQKVIIEKEEKNEKEVSTPVTTHSANKDEVKIICDTRERNSGIVKDLINKNVELVFEQLDIGDYICSDQLIVERKENKDFIASILDKRLFSQSKMLAEVCVKPIMIIEGELSLFQTSLHPQAIAGAISSIIVDFGIPILYTKDQKETAEMLYAFAKREQLEKKRSISSVGKKGIGLKYQMEQLVSMFPQIEHRLAVRLLKHFGSIRDLTSAKLEQFKEIKGIGEKKALDLIDFIYANYNEIESGEVPSETIDKIKWLKMESDEKERKQRKNS